jgi:hypothetical protein
MLPAPSGRAAVTLNRMVCLLQTRLRVLERPHYSELDLSHNDITAAGLADLCLNLGFDRAKALRNLEVRRTTVTTLFGCKLTSGI